MLPQMIQRDRAGERAIYLNMVVRLWCDGGRLVAIVWRPGG